MPGYALPLVQPVAAVAAVCGFCIKKDGDLCHVAPGGKNCWAAFSGDTPPALLCLDAEVEIAGPAGLRRVALKIFTPTWVMRA